MTTAFILDDSMKKYKNVDAYLKKIITHKTRTKKVKPSSYALLRITAEGKSNFHFLNASIERTVTMVL